MEDGEHRLSSGYIIFSKRLETKYRRICLGNFLLFAIRNPPAWIWRFATLLIFFVQTRSDVLFYQKLFIIGDMFGNRGS
jgi:hypothetical protein